MNKRHTPEQIVRKLREADASWPGRDEYVVYEGATISNYTLIVAGTEVQKTGTGHRTGCRSWALARRFCSWTWRFHSCRHGNLGEQRCMQGSSPYAIIQA
jgi:hypothetical protein